MARAGAGGQHTCPLFRAASNICAVRWATLQAFPHLSTKVPRLRISGSITALATPFTAAGEIDLDAWQRLLQLQLDGGTQGVVVAGSTGEAAALYDAEYDACCAARSSTSAAAFRCSPEPDCRTPPRPSSRPVAPPRSAPMPHWS